VTFLLSHRNLDVNCRNACGSTALHAAAAHGQRAVAGLLLAHPGCDASACNEDGETPAAAAAGHGHTALADALQQRAPLRAGDPEAAAAAVQCSTSEAQASDAVCGQVPVRIRADGSTHAAQQSTGGTGEPPAQHVNEASALGGCVAAHVDDGASSECTSGDAWRGARDVREGMGTARADCGASPDPVEPSILAQSGQPGSCQPVRGPAPCEAASEAPSQSEDLFWSASVDWASLVSKELGTAWLAAAKAGDLGILEDLFSETPCLLVYRGQGTSSGFCGAPGCCSARFGACTATAVLAAKAGLASGHIVHACLLGA
jgi:Ankyrin repeats (many copies)